MGSIDKKYRRSLGVPRRLDSFEFLYLRPISHLMSNVEDKYEENTDGRLLFDAIRKGKQNIVRFILEAAPGNVVNARDFNGKTPLMVVSSIKEEFRRASVTRLLLYHGADVNLPDDNQRTPLSHACEKRCNDLVDIFIKQSDIDPDIPDKKGNTPLMYCVMVGNDHGANTLLRYFRRLGLKVDTVNKDGYTPMVVAAKNGYISCARILFQHGQASLLSKDPESNRTVEELLQKNGFTLEDLLPYARQMEARKRFQKIFQFAKLAKSLSTVRYSSTKSCFPRASFVVSADLYEKECFPRVQNRTHLRSLPPIQSNDKTNKKTKSRGKNLPHWKQNGSALVGREGAAAIIETRSSSSDNTDIDDLDFDENDLENDNLPSDNTDEECVI